MTGADMAVRPCQGERRVRRLPASDHHVAKGGESVVSVVCDPAEIATSLGEAIVASL
jgi:hypothetical protein